MASEAQKNKGYELPEQITGHDLICVRLKIPDVPEYRAAFRGALKSLEEWWNWEKRGDKSASEAAGYWRQLIYQYLRFADCDELDLFGGDGMADFDMCWFVDVDGNKVLRWTLNGGCTWNDVGICDDSTGTENPPENPDPINDPVDTPDLGGWLSNCQIVNGVLHDLVTYRLYHFVDDIFCTAIYTDGSVAAGRTALIGWLKDRAMMTNTYFEAFYALMQKYADSGCAFRNFMDDEGDLWNYLQCEGLLCMTGEITRTVMSCFGDTIDAFTPSNYGALEHAAFGAFFKDFIGIYPIEELRRFATNLVPAVVDNDCSGCDVTPVNDCGVAFQYRWRGNPGMDFGWITLPDGDASEWSISDADFTGRTFSPMSLASGWGWQLFTGQTHPPLYAGAVQLSYDDPFHLCEFMAVIYNSTNANNTRLGVAWARVAGTGTWVPLGHGKVPIGTQGIISIIWQGDLMVDRLLIAGASGGGYIRFQQVDVNWSME